MRKLLGMQFSSKGDLVEYIQCVLEFDILGAIGNFKDGFFNWNVIDCNESDGKELNVYIQHTNGLINRVEID